MPETVTKNTLIYKAFNKKIGNRKPRNVAIDILIKYWKMKKQNPDRITNNLRKKRS